MKRILLTLALLTGTLLGFSQNDIYRTMYQLGSSRSVVDYNLKAGGVFYMPHNTGIPTLNGGKDSTGAAWVNNKAKLFIYRRGGTWKEYATLYEVDSMLNAVSSSTVWGGITGILSNQTDLQTALNLKQATLVSGTNIKTVNGNTLLGSGDLVINSMVYPGAGIPISTGTAWGTSITNNSSNWNTAFGWGNHASAGYFVGTSSTIRALFSNTATGLTYTSATGVTSLTSGYVIPTTTQETNWNTAYTNRITSLTTTGSSGTSTLVSNVLNIPTYTLSGLGGQPQLNGTGFVKATGTTISYDNSTYLTTSGGSLAGISGLSLTTPNSIYQMTSTIPVEFKTSDANTLLYLDETNERVGVGTSSPTSREHIVISGTTEIGQKIDAGTSAGISSGDFVQYRKADGTVSSGVSYDNGAVFYTNRWIQFNQTGTTTNKWHIGSYGNNLNFVETGVADGRLFLNPGGNVTIGSTSSISRFAVPIAPTASANYGLVSLGSGAFDGSTAGFYVGSASGTVLAINEATGFVGNLVDFQVAGESKMKLGITTTTLQLGNRLWINYQDGQPAIWANPNINFTIGIAGSYAGGGASDQIRFNGNQILLRPLNTANILCLTDAGVGIGLESTLSAKLHLRGIGATSATSSLYVDNSSNERILQIKNNRTVTIQGSPNTLASEGFALNVGGAISTSWPNDGADALAIYGLSNTLNLYINSGGKIGTNGRVAIGTTTFSSTSYLHIPVAPTASSNYGLFSIGDGPFDGSTAGFFSGSANGTLIAGNLASGSTSDLMNLQVGGNSKFKVTSSSAVTASTFNGVALVTGGTATKYLSEDGTYTTPSGGGGSSTFIGLTDVPATFTGQSLKVVRVNAAETALEFITLASGGTVTSVATGLGLSGGTITTSGTILVDTADANIISRQRAAMKFYPINSNPNGYLSSITAGNGVIVSGATIYRDSLKSTGQYGNSWQNGMMIKSTNNRSMLFGTNNLLRMKLDSNGLWSLNTPTAASANISLISGKGKGSTSATNSIYMENSSAIETFKVTNEGAIYCGGIGFMDGRFTCSDYATMTTARSTNSAIFSTGMKGNSSAFNSLKKTISDDAYWIRMDNTVSGISFHTALTGASGTTAADTANETMRLNNAGLLMVKNKIRVGTLYNGATAKVHIEAGSTTAGSAPLKFTSGSLLTTPEVGAVETLNDTLYYTGSSTTRKYVNTSLRGKATLDFGSTAAGTVSDLTITVTGATDGDMVTLGVPNSSVVAGGSFSAWVSATNTVTVRYSNNSLVTTYDPASGVFKVNVVK